jgi:hypothetical protein
MSGAPHIYWIGELKRESGVSMSHPTLGYVPARPMGFQGLCLRTRLRAAWLVFTGRADVVRWYE